MMQPFLAGFLIGAGCGFLLGGGLAIAFVVAYAPPPLPRTPAIAKPDRVEPDHNL